jgi:alkyl hydroperoxide reductase subunit AhpC
VLFSHPRAFTPVCTTELGYLAKIKPEFDARGVKIIGLSVDPVENTQKWAGDIADTQGEAPNYPVIGDKDFTVAKLYGMLPADVEGDPTARTPAQNQTVRNVFVIGPDKKLKLILIYPMTTGRNFDEVLRVMDSLKLTAEHRVATPVRSAGRTHQGVRAPALLTGVPRRHAGGTASVVLDGPVRQPRQDRGLPGPAGRPRVMGAPGQNCPLGSRSFVHEMEPGAPSPARIEEER